MNIFLVFLTGLSLGGFTCLAVQGGLLASLITQSENKKTDKIKTITITALFLLSKLVAYTILGFLLGLFGNVISLSGTLLAAIQLFAGVYMVAVALNLLEIHPIFKYTVIQPPKFLFKVIKNQSRSKEFFAPILLGALTIFIPCGTTLAIEALAITTANPLLSALTVGAFILGTIPVFLGIGVLTSLLNNSFKQYFIKFAAIAIIFMGLTSVNGALIALNSPVNAQTLIDNFPLVARVESNNPSTNNVNTSQNIEIQIIDSGYSPDYFKVKKGETVNLTITNKGVFSCAAAFRIPSLGISKTIRPNQSETVSFTPTSVGKIQFNCSMGMYRGIIEVVE